MEYKLLTGEELRRAFINGSNNLCCAEAYINSLNVFPVPDGDTGTNMSKTLAGALKNVTFQAGNVGDFMKEFSDAILFSARGNSGVILSQFIRGFACGCSDIEALDVKGLQNALSCGVTMAYNAVINPVEGTMLTVIRESAEAFAAIQTPKTFQEAFLCIVQAMKHSLKNTPNLLPVLKEAGVVDSGGMGMVYIFEGMEAYFEGKIIEGNTAENSEVVSVGSGTVSLDEDMEYGYCTEFILQFMRKKTEIDSFFYEEMISFLEEIGDSIAVVHNENILKVHVHTKEPDKVLSYARRFGEFLSVKIENMSLQHSELLEEKKHYKYAIVGAVTGEGLKKYFKEIGMTEIIDGGQTDNPSAADFINVFQRLDAEYIVVLPNNPNIILTAIQAKEMCPEKNVFVIPTKTVAEGYSALSMMDMSAENIELFIESMTNLLPGVTSISITQAVNDACLNGVKIHEGEHIAVVNGHVTVADTELCRLVLTMLQKLPDIEEKQVITMFWGKNIQEAEIERIKDEIYEAYPLIEVGAIYGGQDIYSLYMAIE